MRLTAPRTPRSRGRTGPRALALLLLLLTAATCALAQVSVDTNQVTGSIRLTNVSPDILAIIDDPGRRGFTSGQVGAASQPPAPASSASTAATVLGWREATYAISVAASAGGTVHSVTPSMALGRNQMPIPALLSAPVLPEPAPDIALDFTTCVGVLDVRFVDSTGAPVVVETARLLLYRPWPGFDTRAIAEQGSTPLAVSQDEFIVRGSDDVVTLEVTYTLGTDEYVDELQVKDAKDCVVRCDEIVPVTFVVPDRAGELGRIIGVVDVLGETEHLQLTADGHPRTTEISAWVGPFWNSRRGGVLATPSSGAYELPNILASSIVDPPEPYLVRARAEFRTGRRFQSLGMPELDGPNGRVIVEGGQTVDLGDTFVIDPGLVHGDIEIRGPARGLEPGTPSLTHLSRASDFDANGDGIPDGGTTRSRIGAFGSDLLAPGSTRSSTRGNSTAEFEGSFDPSRDAFIGDYELVLGGLARGSAYWTPSYLGLLLEDTTTPAQPRTYLSNGLMVRDQTMPAVLVGPGSDAEIDRRICLGRFEVGFRSTGAPFFNPALHSIEGWFVATDAFGASVNQDLSVSASGTPLDLATASDRGLVVAVAPQGVYRLEPSVTSVNPGGGTSWLRLPPFQLYVGCGQVIELLPELVPRLNLPTCSAEATLAASVSFNSEASVARATLEVNGAPAVELCTNCGVDPTIPLDLALEPCDNTVRVVAEDVSGRVASVAGVVRRDSTAPAITCVSDQVITASPGAPCQVPRAQIVVPTIASDDCDGSVPVRCDLPYLLAVGTTHVTCTATDRCLNVGTCEFDVTVLIGPGEQGARADAGPDILLSCPELSGILSGSAPGAGAGGIDALWSPEDGLIDPRSLVTTVTAPGEFTLTITDLATGCVTTDSVTVGLEPSSFAEPSAVDLVPGVEPLRVTKGAPDALVLTWEAGGGDIHAGTIAALTQSRWYDHGALDCDILDSRLDVALPVGNVYYVVLRGCGGFQGSAGRDSFGSERWWGWPDCP